MSVIAHTPEEAVQLLDDAFNRGDLCAIVRCYEDNAIVVPMPGTEARGSDAIRSMYAQMLRPGIRAEQVTTKVLEADNIALFLSHWTLHIEGAPSQNFTATTVFREGADGGWRALIDNARGPDILNA